MKGKKNKNNKVNNINNIAICNDVKLLIEAIKSENDRQIENLEKMLSNFYDKNKKENEVHGIIDGLARYSMTAIFILLGVAFLASIYSVITNDGTLANKIILVADFVMISFVSITLGISFIKEKNRNFIISCFSALMALLAIIIALSK